MIQILGDVMRGLCFLLAWAFVVRYSRVTWTHSDEGRHLMGFTLVIALFMTLAVTTRIFGRFTGLDLIGITLFALLTGLLVHRNILLTRAQRERAKSAADTTEQG